MHSFGKFVTELMALINRRNMIFSLLLLDFGGAQFRETARAHGPPHTTPNEIRNAFILVRAAPHKHTQFYFEKHSNKIKYSILTDISGFESCQMLFLFAYLPFLYTAVGSLTHSTVVGSYQIHTIYTSYK